MKSNDPVNSSFIPYPSSFLPHVYRLNPASYLMDVCLTQLVVLKVRWPESGIDQIAPSGVGA
jgi:hypothetical protein